MNCVWRRLHFLMRASCYCCGVTKLLHDGDVRNKVNSD